MHAKGWGARGTFTVTRDIGEYTKASIFSKVRQADRPDHALLDRGLRTGRCGSFEPLTGTPDAYYEPNSFSGPADDNKFLEPPLTISGDAERYNHRDGNDDDKQAGDLFRVIPPDSHERLMDNIAEAMQGVPLEIVKRQVVHFYRADPNYGIGVATRIGPGEPSWRLPTACVKSSYPANEVALNAAIIENQIAPQKIISVMLQQGEHLAIGDHEPKYRMLYRL